MSCNKKTSGSSQITEVMQGKGFRKNLQFYYISGLYRLITGQYDLQRVHDIIQMSGEIQIFLNGFQEILLLKQTEFVMPRLFRGIKYLIVMNQLPIFICFGGMET